MIQIRASFGVPFLLFHVKHCPDHRITSYNVCYTKLLRVCNRRRLPGSLYGELPPEIVHHLFAKAACHGQRVEDQDVLPLLDIAAANQSLLQLKRELSADIRVDLPPLRRGVDQQEEPKTVLVDQQQPAPGGLFAAVSEIRSYNFV